MLGKLKVYGKRSILFLVKSLIYTLLSRCEKHLNWMWVRPTIFYIQIFCIWNKVVKHQKFYISTFSTIQINRIITIVSVLLYCVAVQSLDGRELIFFYISTFSTIQINRIITIVAVLLYCVAVQSLDGRELFFFIF